VLRQTGRLVRWWTFILVGLLGPERLRLRRPPPWRPVATPAMARVGVRVDVVRPVLYGDLVPASFTNLPLSVQAPEPSVSVAENVVLFPGHTFVDRRSGRLLPQSLDVTHDPEILSGKGMRPPRLFGRLEEVRNEAFVVDCHHTGTYGHNLLEALPGLMLLDHVPSDVEIATSIPRSPTIEALIGSFGVDTARVRYYRGPLFCRSARLPERLVHLNRSVHPLAREAFSRMKRLAAHASIAPPERVFISRSGIQRRRLVNEADIERMFERHGFSIVHPERLPIADQIAVFANAPMIAGLGGSAMHNTVFTPPDSRVLLVSNLEWFMETDVLISQRDGQLGYVFGSSLDDADDVGERTWRVDPAAVEAAIVAHFGF
jgi:capsular polysaccharide biosynthesis protein